MYKELRSAKYHHYLPKVTLVDPGSSSTDPIPENEIPAATSSVPSSPFISTANRIGWSHQRTWSTGVISERSVPLANFSSKDDSAA